MFLQLEKLKIQAGPFPVLSSFESQSKLLQKMAKSESVKGCHGYVHLIVINGTMVQWSGLFVGSML